MGQNDAYMNQDRETKEKTTDVGKRGVWVCFPSLKRKRWFFLPGALFASKKVCSPPLHLSLSLLLAGFLVSAPLHRHSVAQGVELGTQKVGRDRWDEGGHRVVVWWLCCVCVLCFALFCARLLLVFCVCLVFACVRGPRSCRTHAYTRQMLGFSFIMYRGGGNSWERGERWSFYLLLEA